MITSAHSWKILAETRMEFIEYLCEKHNINYSEEAELFYKQENIADEN